jgi:hypothetical protein
MELAKIFCVTRDEYDLIEDFILYYGYFFGYNNIIIIDNNSIDPIVLNVYKKYASLGVTIVNTPDYKTDSQGKAFTKFMLEYVSQCKWLIGLDTDEFMAPVDEEQDLLDILQNIPSNISFCHIFEHYNSIVDITNQDYINHKFNHPAKSITTFYLADIPKRFYKSESFISTGNGNHSGQVDTNFNYTNIVAPIRYIHFHSVGKKREIERAATIIDGYNYTNVHGNLFQQWDELRTITGGNGAHRVIQYKNFIIRKILIDLFCRYIKRPPTPKELNTHGSRMVNEMISSREIVHEFKECPEAKNKITSQEYSIPEKQEHGLLYSEANLPEKHRTSTYVKDILNSL